MRRARIATAMCLVIAALILAADVHTPLGIATGVLYSAIILMSLWMPRTNPFALALVTSALTLAAMIKTGGVAPGWAVAANRGLSIAVQLAAAFMVALYREQERQRRDAFERAEHALAHARGLEGLLPICAWCKRIRDESGQWQQLEVYIRDRSDADFTHGACPECAERILNERRRGMVP